MANRYPRPPVVKPLLRGGLKSALLFIPILLFTGCQTGFDRSMDYKDSALNARKDTAILSLGGEITETTSTAPDKTVTVTKTTRLGVGGAAGSGSIVTLEPGARVEFGTFVRNAGAVPVDIDPQRFAAGGGDRRVAETEKLALLESYWGETGNFMPKSAYEQTLGIAARVALGYFIYDAGKAVIESNNNIASQALSTPPTIVEPTVIIP